MNNNAQFPTAQKQYSQSNVQVFDSNYANNEDEDEIDLRALWRIVRRYRRLIGVIFSVVVFTAFLVTLLLRPMYQSVVTLEVNTTGRSIVKFQNVESQDLGTREYIQTQSKILNSDAVAEKVVRELELVTNPEFNGQLSQRGLINGLKSIMGVFKPKVDTSDSDLIQDALRIYFERLSIKPERNTSLIYISFESFSPELAASIANAHAKAYISLSDFRRFNSTSGAKEFLEKEINIVQSRLETSEKQLNDFARKNGVIDVEDRNNIMMERLGELNRSLSEVQARRIDAETKSVQAKSSDSEFLSGVNDDPLISALRQEQASLKSEYFELSKIYKPKYPVMLQLSAKISELENSIQQQIDKIVGGLDSNYQQLKLSEELVSSELEKLKIELLNLQDRAVTYNILKREWEANKGLYSGLLERTKEVGVAAGMELNIASIVDLATASKSPSSPNLKLNLLIAAFLGLAAGLGAAFLLAMLDNTVNDVDQLHQITQVGHLGVSPKINLDNGSKIESAKHMKMLDLIVHHDPGDAFSESIQSVRTSLSYARAGGFPKSIMLTSSLASEGKSTVTVNLAISCAKAGKRVIIVEADLRRSRLYKVFKVPSSPGLSDYLVDNKEVVPYKVKQIENLSVLVGGTKTPNPVDLLGSQGMMELIKSYEQEYDLVIVDCPPVLMLADAVIVSRMVESVLFVVMAHETPKDAIKGSVQRLKSVGAPLIGTVLNKVQSSHAGYDYDYSYRYQLDDQGVS